jgi:hypothetical protein
VRPRIKNVSSAWEHTVIDALTGVNDSRLGIVDPRQAAHLRLDRLRTQVEAGDADTIKLQQRLTAAFGSQAAGIVGDDDSVDFERLRDFAADQGSARLLLELTAHLDADDVDITEDVVVGGNDIRENIVERNQAIARERLRREFGSDAEQFISTEGSIDFEALREFLEQQRVHVERLQNLELGPATLIDIET